MPKVKFGVYGLDLSFLHPKMWEVLKELTNLIGDDWTITSTKEGTHLPYSKHYQGKAIDIELPFKDKTNVEGDDRNWDLCIDLGRKFNKEFDILLKETHIHIEYDPKGGVKI